MEVRDYHKTNQSNIPPVEDINNPLPILAALKDGLQYQFEIPVFVNLVIIGVVLAFARYFNTVIPLLIVIPYLALYIITILRKTANGIDRGVWLPEFKKESAIKDAMRWIFSAVVSFAPVIFTYLIVSNIFTINPEERYYIEYNVMSIPKSINNVNQVEEDERDKALFESMSEEEKSVTITKTFIISAVLLLCILYYPIALISFAFYPKLKPCFNPIFIIKNMGKILDDYLPCMLIASAIFLPSLAVELIIDVSDIPYSYKGIFTIILTFLELYFYIALVRIIGLLYETSKERLGWV